MQHKGNYADNCPFVDQTYIENVDKLIYEGQGSCLKGIKALLKSRDFDGQLKRLNRMKVWAIVLPTIEIVMILIYLILTFKFVFVLPHHNRIALSPFMAYLLLRFMQFLYVAIILGLIVNFVFFLFRPSPKALYDYLSYLDTILHSAVGRCNDLDEALTYIKRKRMELDEAYRILPILIEKLRRT